MSDTSALYPRMINLGNPVAEKDNLLGEAFVRGTDFDLIEDLDEKRILIVGRTGSGKSAALAYLERIHRERVVRIDPRKLGLSYIANNNVVSYFNDTGVAIEQFYQYLWKHVFVVEILQHINSNVHDLSGRKSLIDRVVGRLRGSQNELYVRRFVDEYGDRFWEDTEEIVTEVVQRFSSSLETVLAVSGGLHIPQVSVTSEAAVGQTTEQEIEIKTQSRKTLQEAVSAMQLQRTERALQAFSKEMMRTSSNYLYVVIDDLDKDWHPEGQQDDLLRGLYEAAEDLAQIDRFKILVALRTNIFVRLDSPIRKKLQREKVESSTVAMSWTINGLAQMVNERLRVFCQRNEFFPVTIDEILPKEQGDQIAFEYICDRTLLRPRDVLMFLSDIF